MSKNKIYIFVAIVVIGGAVWYIMRAQRQAATIAGAGALPVTPSGAPDGAAT